jgi:osmotically inducible lipoprotein OsmB
MKRVTIGLVVLVCVFALLSCADMTRTQQRTLSGAAIGAGGGALLGEIVGDQPFAGAAIGAAVGALGGYIAGESDDGYYHHGHRR